MPGLYILKNYSQTIAICFTQLRIPYLVKEVDLYVRKISSSSSLSYRPLRLLPRLRVPDARLPLLHSCMTHIPYLSCVSCLYGHCKTRSVCQHNQTLPPSCRPDYGINCEELSTQGKMKWPTSDDPCVRELRDNRGAQGSPEPPDIYSHHELPVHGQSRGPPFSPRNTEHPARRSHGHPNH